MAHLSTPDYSFVLSHFIPQSLCNQPQISSCFILSPFFFPHCNSPALSFCNPASINLTQVVKHVRFQVHSTSSFHTEPPKPNEKRLEATVSTKAAFTRRPSHPWAVSTVEFDTRAVINQYFNHDLWFMYSLMICLLYSYIFICICLGCLGFNVSIFSKLALIFIN